MKPEEEARKKIDSLLELSGWKIEDYKDLNLGADMGVAVREFPLKGAGFADYLLFVERHAVGVIEAKPAGVTLSGVSEQTEKYLHSLPENIPHVGDVLPFAYESTGVETFFRDLRDPDCRSRRVFAFHKSDTLHEWVHQEATLRQRLRSLPPLIKEGLRGCQEEKLLKAWCERDEVDYEFVKALKEKIFPLLEEAHRRQGSAFDRVFLEQKKGTDLRIDNSARLLNILHKKLDRNKFTNEEIKAISLHLEFLPLVEGFFATLINFLIFTLIANGHDFYSKWKRSNIKFLDDIEQEDLACRIRFLENNGFAELAENKDRIRNLRNSTAHVFYEIDPIGDVQIGQEIVSSKAYDEYYDYLRSITFAVHNIQTLFYFEHFASLSPKDMERIKNVKLEEVKCACGNVNWLPDDRNVLGQQFTCTKCKKPI